MPLTFDAAQELSKSFTRTILKSDRESPVREDAVEPGIFLVSKIAAKGLELDLSRAVFLRLLTPRNQHLSLSLGPTGCVSAPFSVNPKTRPPSVSAESGTQSALTHIRTVLTDAITSRLVSTRDSKS